MENILSISGKYGQDNKAKYRPVRVRADFLYLGDIIPLYYIDENGKQIDIDKDNCSFKEMRGNIYCTCMVKPHDAASASPKTVTLMLSFYDRRWYLRVDK